MDQLELLKKYQQIDAKVDELEAVVRNSDVRKRLIRARQYLLSSQDALQKMETQAGEMRMLYENLFNRYEQMQERLERIGEDVKSADVDTPLHMVEALRREAQEVYGTLGKMEKDLQRMMETLKAIDDKFVRMVQNVPKAKNDYAEMKKVYDVKVEEMNSQAAPFRNELKELEGKIDRALLKRYRNVKQNHAMPLVSVNGNRCTGCNMELPYVMQQRIKEGQKMLECENCGRILYVPRQT